jgi:hypothetical protein
MNKNIESNKKKGKSNRGFVVLLIIIVLILGAAVGVLLLKMDDFRMEAEKKEAFLEDQKTVLEGELSNLNEQFGALQTNNDSLKQRASEQQDIITKLLKEKGDNLYKIKMYQTELESLRGILKHMYYQIDSLNQLNIALMAEKSELTKNLAAERSQSARLTEEKKQMTTTVQKAQVLSAADVRTTGLTSRNKETPRVRNVEKLQTCFTVRENAVAVAGERVFYLIITKPDKKTLNNKNNDVFLMQDGTAIVYTDRRAIQYENTDIEVCIFSDNNGRLTEGNYDVKVYCEGYLVGSSSFNLR